MVVSRETPLWKKWCFMLSIWVLTLRYCIGLASGDNQSCCGCFLDQHLRDLTRIRCAFIYSVKHHMNFFFSSFPLSGLRFCVSCRLYSGFSPKNEYVLVFSHWYLVDYFFIGQLQSFHWLVILWNPIICSCHLMQAVKAPRWDNSPAPDRYELWVPDGGGIWRRLSPSHIFVPSTLIMHLSNPSVS